MRGVVKAWGWYVAGAATVLLALWLYARRFYFELERELVSDEESD